MSHLDDLVESQCKVLVEEMLLRRFSRNQIAKAFENPKPEAGVPRLSKAQCDRLIREIKLEWQSASQATREERRESQRRSLENLYRTAFDKGKYGVCLGVERLLAELDGTMAPKKVDVTLPGAANDDEFEDKSEMELEYFAATGRWPLEEKRH